MVAADLGSARLTPVDEETQIARATEYRTAKAELQAAIMACRIAPEFVTNGAGGYISGPAYREVLHVRERRAHALNLKSHAGRIRALQSLTEYVRKL